MIQNIIEGLSVKLTELYPNATVYQDDVEQGLKEPCFFITPLIVFTKDYIMGRRRLDIPFDITYIDEGQSVLIEVGETLLRELEFLTIENNGLLRGNKRQFEIVDNVLHFSIEFSCCFTRENERELLETLEQAKGVVNG